MAFKPSSELVFPWPVKVIEPDQANPGKLVEHDFTGLFAIIPPEQARARDEARLEIIKKIDALRQKVAASGIAVNSPADLPIDEIAALEKELSGHDVQAVREVFRGWRDGVEDDSGKLLPSTPENIAFVFSLERVRKALVRAYREAISEDKARLGN